MLLVDRPLDQLMLDRSFDTARAVPACRGQQVLAQGPSCKRNLARKGYSTSSNSPQSFEMMTIGRFHSLQTPPAPASKLAWATPG